MGHTIFKFNTLAEYTKWHKSVDWEKLLTDLVEGIQYGSNRLSFDWGDNKHSDVVASGEFESGAEDDYESDQDASDVYEDVPVYGAYVYDSSYHSEVAFYLEDSLSEEDLIEFLMDNAPDYVADCAAHYLAKPEDYAF